MGSQMFPNQRIGQHGFEIAVVIMHPLASRVHVRVACDWAVQSCFGFKIVAVFLFHNVYCDTTCASTVDK